MSRTPRCSPQSRRRPLTRSLRLYTSHSQPHSAHNPIFHIQTVLTRNRTENVTYEYTVTPKSHGPTTVPRTHITYDDSTEAYIDAELRLLVESPEEYAKRTDRHIVCAHHLPRDRPHRVSPLLFSAYLWNRSTGSSTSLPPCWLRAFPPSSSTRRTRRSSESGTGRAGAEGAAQHAARAHRDPPHCVHCHAHTIPPPPPLPTPLRSDVCMTAATSQIETL